MNPKTTNDIFSLPSSNTMTKKYYDPTAVNTNSYSNQPITAASNVYQTATTAFSQNQPNAVNAMQLQQMYDGRDTNAYTSELRNNVGEVNPITNIQGYVSNFLADEIKEAINFNLPDSYTSNSPEVKEYIRKVILVDERVFQDQVSEFDIN